MRLSCVDHGYEVVADLFVRFHTNDPYYLLLLVCFQQIFLILPQVTNSKYLPPFRAILSYITVFYTIGVLKYAWTRTIYFDSTVNIFKRFVSHLFKDGQVETYPLQIS